MEPWQALRFVHILSVIVALGANLTYLFWMGRARSEPAQLVFVIESIRRLDRRVSNPAYIVAAAAGIGIVLTGPYGFQTPWIVASIGLYVLVAILGITVYAPAMRTQLDLAQRAPASHAYAAAARRSRILFFLVTAIVVTIVVLMVIEARALGGLTAGPPERAPLPYSSGRRSSTTSQCASRRLNRCCSSALNASWSG